MTLRILSSSMIAAFVAGAALVHCGNTDFAAATDGGADGSPKGPGSGSEAGGKQKDSGARDTGGSGSGGVDSGNIACDLSYAKNCPAAATCCPNADPLCCGMPANNGSPAVTTCNTTATCPAGSFKTCSDTLDCLGFGGSCCVDPTSKAYGVCVTQAECVSPAVVKCSSKLDCPAGDVCDAEECVPAPDSGKAKDSGVTTHDACVAGTCSGEYQGRCGNELNDGCGGSINCPCNPSGTHCSTTAAGVAGTCIASAPDSGTCTSGLQCGGKCCGIEQTCMSGNCEYCTLCGTGGSAMQCCSTVAPPICGEGTCTGSVGSG